MACLEIEGLVLFDFLGRQIQCVLAVQHIIILWKLT